MLKKVDRIFRHPAAIFGLLALLVATTGLALAANPSSDGTITGCVNKKTKVLRLADSKNRCKHGESKLGWNQKGQPGRNGVNGSNGTNGTNGTDGQPGADAAATTRATVAGEDSTTSTSQVTLGGPDVTVQVPAAGANIVIGASYDAKNSNGANNACVWVYEGGTLLNGFGCLASGTYVRGHGSLLIAADGGSHTYTLRYSSPGATTASFQNRTLMISVLR